MTRLSFSFRSLLYTLVTAASLVSGLKFDASLADYNINTNRRATNPLEYSGPTRDKYFASPSNWRVPFYTIFLDRFVNGDPSNDDINGTVYETDMMSTQLRFGGDLEGLRDSLDYIAGMGIKVTYHHGRGTVVMQHLTASRASTSRGPRSSTSHGALIRTRSVTKSPLAGIRMLTTMPSPST
jgi:alpha-1,3-glucan synthase